MISEVEIKHLRYPKVINLFSPLWYNDFIIYYGLMDYLIRFVKIRHNNK